MTENNILHITENNINEFDKEIKKDNLTIVDFFAEWCGPCKMLSPIIEELAKDNKEINWIKVDVDDAQQISARYMISSIPTLVFLKNENVVHKSIGYKPKEEIEKLIKEYK